MNNAMNNTLAYDILQRTFSDSALVADLNRDPENTLSQLGVTDANERANLTRMFQLMMAGSATQALTAKELEKQQKGTLDVATEMKQGLKRTLDQIDKAYRSTMLMYQISFYLGVALIIVAVGVALMGRDALLPAVFGGLGMADILAFFLLKPQERLQASRASLAQVQTALYNWYIDSVNLNTLMSQHHMNGDLPSAAALSETLFSHTDKTLEMLQKYCKLDK
ncbi:MAG: hypothetical protein K2Y28_16360 [Burkholderiaceae bacterium]|nr:hypothetical protein [Burkholderiaceae bacterium]